MRIIKVGRNQTNDVVIPNSIVSGQHAILTIMDDGSVYIKDLNSTNHTYVNGQMINESRLNDGDVVKFGGYVFDWKAAVRTPDKTSIHVASAPVIPSDAVESVTIGRDPMSNVRFPYDDVSSRHAILFRNAANEVFVMDCNSTNGTYVNGEKITRKALHKGDMVMIARKYPLQWEKMFHAAGIGNNGKKNGSKNLTIAGIAVMAAAIMSLLIVFKPWNTELSQDEIYAKYKNSVVMIIHEYTYSVKYNGKALSTYLDGDRSLDKFYVDDDNEVQPGSIFSCGTGFFVSNDGKIMTNRHVVNCYSKASADLIYEKIVSVFRSMNIDVSDGLTIEYTPIRYCIARNDQYFGSLNELTGCVLCRCSEDANLDVAYIQTNNKQTPSDVTAIVDVNKYSTDDDIKIGKPIYTIGFPATFTVGSTSEGLEATCQNGTVTQERGDYEYGHNITVLQGASGSPVFDAHGNFAGIIVSGFLGLSQGYNHAVKPARALKFYNN